MSAFRFLLLVTAGLAGMAGPLCAAESIPPNWQLWHPDPATPVMERLDRFHLLLLYIMVAICVFVVALLAYVIVRFRASRNPTPSRVSHNTLVEVAWTVLPIFILIVIALPSFRALYFMDHTADAEMTLKVTGHQWYWSYEYPDHQELTFDALMIPDEDIQPGQFRLLETDRRVVVPVDTTVRVLVTASDVLHSWAVPAFGIKTDAIPGRINESWFRATREGTFYGQCSEICGINHAYMPIAIEVVSKERFAQWLTEAQQARAHPGAKGEVALVRSE